MSMPQNFGVPQAMRSASGHLDFDATQTTVTLKAAKTVDFKMFIKSITVWIKTNAAQSITFQDTAATPLVLSAVPTSPGANTRWQFVFEDAGFPLTTGKNLQAVFSAAGLAGSITWTGYQTKNIAHL